MKIPAAKSADGVICFAVSCERGAYECLACKAPVVLKRGVVKRPHFAHKDLSGCSEGQKHLSTKLWVASLVKDPEFVVQSTCDLCLRTHDVLRGDAALAATVECRVDAPDQVRKFSVDCMVHLDTAEAHRPVAFVEVMSTHAAGDAKLSWLEGRWPSYTPAIEIKAVDLVGAEYPKSFRTMARRRCGPCVKKRFGQRRQLCDETRAKFLHGAFERWRGYKELKAAMVPCELCAKRWVGWCRDCKVLCPCGQFEIVTAGCSKGLRRPCVVCGTWGKRVNMFRLGKEYHCGCAPLCRVCDRSMRTDDYGGRCKTCNLKRHTAKCLCGKGFHAEGHEQCFECETQKRCL
jgi:hypothetical protein